MLSIKELLKQFSSIHESSTFKLNEKAFVISNPWFIKFQKYVGYKAKSTGEKPGPITNTHLLNSNGKLRNNIIGGSDYIIISQNSWNLLYSWFGGGPIIDLDIEFDPIRRKILPILRVPAFFLQFETEIKEISFSKFKKFEHFVKSSCELFNLNPEDYEIKDFFNKKPGKSYKLEKTLIENLIKDGQNFIILPKNNINDEIDNTDPIQIRSQSTLYIDFDEAPKKSCSLIGISEHQSLLPALEPGLVGIQNIGNSCYLSSSLQCLLHTNSFLEDLEKDTSIPTKHNGTYGALFSSFLNLSKLMWSGESSFLNPREFKVILSRLASQFEGTHQHDAHEFITVLLSLLHDELNHSLLKSNDYLLLSNIDPIESWINFKKHNDSIIVDNFYGLLRSQRKCNKCQKIISNFEPYMTLSLPLPQRKMISANFIFVPANPLEAKLDMQLQLLDGFNISEFTDSLSFELKRPVHVAICEISIEKDTIKWMNNWNSPNPKCDIYAYELKNPHALHVVMWPCLCLGFKLTRRNRIIDTPYLVEIPGEGTTKEEIFLIANNYFKFFWVQNINLTCPTLHPEIYDLRERIQPFKKHPDRRIKIELEKRLFSKTMRFKIEKESPHVSRRQVKVTLNTEYQEQHQYHFNWCIIRRPLHQTIFPLKTSFTIPIEQCLNNFSDDSILDSKNKWLCPNCNELVEATLNQNIWTLPKNLIIQLKRFIQDKDKFYKSEINIRYPKILNLKQFIKSNNNEPLNFQLYAINEHNGNLGNGHYTSKIYCKNKWSSFNDSIVSSCSENHVHSQSAYLLFYERIN